MKNVNEIKEQVKGLVETGTTTLKELGVKGKKLATDIKERVEETRTKGSETVMKILEDRSIKDFIDRVGSVKLSELPERLRSLEISQHGEHLRQEMLAKFRIASAENVESLTASVEKLNKEVASLKTLRQELRREIKKLNDAVKALKPKATESKSAAKT